MAILGNKKQKVSDEVPTSSMADIAFLLLIFFLVTTSFVKETGIDVNRPTASTAVSKAKATVLIGIDAAN